MPGILRTAPILMLFAMLPALAGVRYARAQFLDLDTARAPEAGSGARVLGLATRLDQQAEADRGAAERRGGFQQAVLNARASMRETSAAMLRTGESIGASGSTHVLAGLRLHDAAGALDRSLENTAPADRHALLPVLRALDRAPGTVPEQPSLLEPWLRRRYALLAEATRDRALHAARTPVWVADPGRAGWCRAGDAGALPDAVSVARAQPDDAARRAVEALDRRRDAGAALWAYAGTTDAAMIRVLGAWSVIDRDALPGWLPVKHGDALRTTFGRAVVGLSAQRDESIALGDLDALERIGRIIGRVTALGRAGVDLHPPMIDLVRDSVDAPRHADARLRAASDALDLLEARSSLGDERTVARSLRPAWRVLDARADRAERALFADSARLLASPDAMTDPSLVGRIAAHRRALDDLRLVREIGAWLGSFQAPRAPGAPLGEREAEANRRLAQSRVLALSQAVAKDERDALGALRTFGRTLAHAGPVRGAWAVRDDPERFDRFTGRQAEALIRDLDQTRSAWFEAWATEGSRRGSGRDPSVLAGRLERLSRLLGHLDDAATVDAISARRGVGAWPGVLVPADTRSRLIADARRELGSLTTLVLTRDPQIAAGGLDRFGAGDGVLVLLARLERGALAVGVAPAPPVALVSAPMRSDAWMANHRADLHAISRYLFELTGALAAGDRDRANRLERYVRVRCDDLLAVLGPEGSVGGE